MDIYFAWLSIVFSTIFYRKIIHPFVMLLFESAYREGFRDSVYVDQTEINFELFCRYESETMRSHYADGFFGREFRKS